MPPRRAATSKARSAAKDGNEEQEETKAAAPAARPTRATRSAAAPAVAAATTSKTVAAKEKPTGRGRIRKEDAVDTEQEVEHKTPEKAVSGRGNAAKAVAEKKTAVDNVVQEQKASRLSNRSVPVLAAAAAASAAETSTTVVAKEKPTGRGRSRKEEAVAKEPEIEHKTPEKTTSGRRGAAKAVAEKKTAADDVVEEKKVAQKNSEPTEQAAPITGRMTRARTGATPVKVPPPVTRPVKAKAPAGRGRKQKEPLIPEEPIPEVLEEPATIAVAKSIEKPESVPKEPAVEVPTQEAVKAKAPAGRGRKRKESDPVIPDEQAKVPEIQGVDAESTAKPEAGRVPEEQLVELPTLESVKAKAPAGRGRRRKELVPVIPEETVAKVYDEPVAVVEITKKPEEESVPENPVVEEPTTEAVKAKAPAGRGRKRKTPGPAVVEILKAEDPEEPAAVAKSSEKLEKVSEPEVELPKREPMEAKKQKESELAIPEEPVAEVPEKAVVAESAVKPEVESKPKEPVVEEPMQEPMETEVKPSQPSTLSTNGNSQNRKRRAGSEEPGFGDSLQVVELESDRPKKKLRKDLDLQLRTISGFVMVCGSDNFGELGLGSVGPEKRRPVLVTEIAEKEATAIATGAMHTLVLTEDGSKVYTFGCNDELALGRKTEKDIQPELNDTCESVIDSDELAATPTVIALPATKVVQVSAGDSHSAALTEHGAVFVWGNFRDPNGSIGLDAKTSPKPVLLPFNPLPYEVTVERIASGDNHILFLTKEGEVYSMGVGEQGQLGRVSVAECQVKKDKSNVELFLKPHLVNFEAEKKVTIERIWACGHVSFARSTDGKLYAWGLNNFSQLGFKSKTDEKNDIVEFFPVSVSAHFPDSVEKITGSMHHTLALDQAGHVYASGRHHYGPLGLGELKDVVHTPQLLETLREEEIVDIACGNCNSFAVSSKGKLYSWGMASTFLGHSVKDEDQSDILEPKVVESKQLSQRRVLAVASGSSHLVVIASGPETPNGAN